jgi:hypothetical protein
MAGLAGLRQSKNLRNAIGLRSMTNPQETPEETPELKIIGV